MERLPAQGLRGLPLPLLRCPSVGSDCLRNKMADTVAGFRTKVTRTSVTVWIVPAYAMAGISGTKIWTAQMLPLSTARECMAGTAGFYPRAARVA